MGIVTNLSGHVSKYRSGNPAVSDPKMRRSSPEYATSVYFLVTLLEKK
jgi:hypothetical protein